MVSPGTYKKTIWKVDCLKPWGEVLYRSIYTKIASVDYSLHQPRTLNPIPPDKIMGDWEKDYKFIQEAMIYGKSLPFAELIERIKKLKQEINGITWSE